MDQTKIKEKKRKRNEMEKTNQPTQKFAFLKKEEA